MSVRARETVRRRDGSAAEMWIGVSCLAREWSESGRVSGRYDMKQMACCTEEKGQDVEVWYWVGFCCAVECAFWRSVDYCCHSEYAAVRACKHGA